MGLWMTVPSRARTERLRHEIALIQQEEHRYRSHKNHSLAETTEHHKRKFRILAIREELRTLVEETKEVPPLRIPDSGKRRVYAARSIEEGALPRSWNH